jgi:hypothetical protein
MNDNDEDDKSDESSDYIGQLHQMVREAEKHVEASSADRVKAREYHNGVMNDLEKEEGRSSVVQRVIREHAQKILPSLVRTLLGNEDIVEYLPEQPEDVEASQQKTDYVNQIVIPESGGHVAIQGAIEDALIVRNGILRIVYEEKIEIEASRHSGLTQEEAIQLVSDPDVEVLEQSPPDQDGLFSLFIKRTQKKGKNLIEHMPRDEFLIDPRATCIDDATLTGTKKRLRRSDLVAMGYEREKILSIGMEDGENISSMTERQARRLEYVSDEASRATANQEITYYDLYVKLDKDDDGIAELRHVCFAGDINENGLLMDEYACEVPFADLKVKAKPNQFEGVSLVDDLEEIQRIQSFLLRETFDNVKWQNAQMLAYQEGTVKNPDALFTPEFGKTIRTQAGIPVDQAVQFLNVPDVTPNTLNLMGYFKGEAQNRTGISDASGGLSPDALQNVTAKASAMFEQQGISQADSMGREISWGLRRAFLILLKQVIRHQDKPRTVRLRNKWVPIDPKTWNAALDCSVNTGLGTGTRERDIMAMMAVLQVQERIVASLGEDNPFVTPRHLSNTFQRFAMASGIKQPRLHFGEPDENQIAEWMQKRAQRQDPEMMKIQAQSAAKMQELQATMPFEAELKKMDVDAAREKEVVQSQAAVEEKIAIAKIDEQAKQNELLLKKYEIDTKAQIEREKIDAQSSMETNKLAADANNTQQDHSFQVAREQAKSYGESEGQFNQKAEDLASKKFPELVRIVSDLQEKLKDVNKPKKVTTPDGEVFTMETVN